MKKVIDHSIQSSLLRYLQYRTLVDLEAYHTVTGELFRYEDPRYDLIAYGAPEGGWVYDKISGVIPPSIPGYSRGVSGMVCPDFINGRFLFSGDFPNIPLTGSYTVSEVNYYNSSDSMAKILFEDKYQQSPVLKPAASYLEPYSFITPCVFVKAFETNNEPYCLGGEDWTIVQYKLICLMPNESYLAGIGKVIRDCRQEIFPLLKNFALNQYGDLKTINWDYEHFMKVNDYYGFISDATFKPEEPDVFISQNPNMFIGIGNIEVRIVRRPGDPNSDVDLSTSYALTDISDIFDTDIQDEFTLD